MSQITIRPSGIPLPFPRAPLPIGLQNPAISVSLPLRNPLLQTPIRTWQPYPYQPLSPAVMPLKIPPSTSQNKWTNQLKHLLHTNQAVMYALHIRTFGAIDKNGDGQISFQLGESGTFLSAISKLDELAALGVNVLHLLPLHPPSKTKRLGEGGSPYAPADYHQLNPEYHTPGSGLNIIQEARLFVQEAHRRGIHVMVDVPSCASHDLAQTHPELIAKDLQGNPLVPTHWIDILMFQNGEGLRQYYEGFFDLMVNQVGVDGFRVDVARARPPWFWDHFIQKYPNYGWFAETYTQEDASPLANIPRDIPETLLKIGFDSIYGQFHIFHSMKNADEYIRYLLDGNEMFKRTGVGKSFAGSFLTHDDPSMMEHGGVPMYILTSGLMATQPWTNPYIVDGFTTGYEKPFDIFNFRPRPVGKHPEIGLFLKRMLDIRKAHRDTIGQGLFIPIPVFDTEDNQIIAFARHHQGKTLLVVANKDVNARHTGILYIPGLKMDQQLVNLAPPYGTPSEFVVDKMNLGPGHPNETVIQVNLGPGRFHLFEIDTSELPLHLRSYR